jgi:Fe-S-cluster containining protein
MSIPLPVVSDSQSDKVECTDCGRCCMYVAIEIDPPTRPRNATDILWYLYHPGISIYVDGNEEWCIQFESRCENLGEDLLCKIYRQRPHICRGFDSETCEVNGKEGEAFTLRTPDEFLAYLRKERPRVYKMMKKQFVPDGRPPGSRDTLTPSVSQGARVKT